MDYIQDSLNGSWKWCNVSVPSLIALPNEDPKFSPRSHALHATLHFTAEPASQGPKTDDRRPLIEDR